jgi:hypothetical protein
MITVNGQVLLNPNVVKYLGVYLDDKLLWSHHVNYVFKLCCQRIGMFKKVLYCLPSHVVVLYYNAFIRSCFSYCIMFWYNNNRSGKYKLSNKVDSLISFLSNRLGLCVHEFVSKHKICNVNNVYNLQMLSFMYDLCNNLYCLPHFSVNTTQ